MCRMRIVRRVSTASHTEERRSVALRTASAPRHMAQRTDAPPTPYQGGTPTPIPGWHHGGTMTPPRPRPVTRAQRRCSRRGRIAATRVVHQVPPRREAIWSCRAMELLLDGAAERGLLCALRPLCSFWSGSSALLAFCCSRCSDEQPEQPGGGVAQRASLVDASSRFRLESLGWERKETTSCAQRTTRGLHISRKDLYVIGCDPHP